VRDEPTKKCGRFRGSATAFVHDVSPRSAWRPQYLEGGAPQSKVKGSSTPILFLSFHRRRIRVLKLQPVGRPPRPITRAEALRHNPLGTQLAGVMKHGGAVGMRYVLVQTHPCCHCVGGLARVALALASYRGRPAPADRRRTGRHAPRSAGDGASRRSPDPSHRSTGRR
jgi:hypothetical protein